MHNSGARVLPSSRRWSNPRRRRLQFASAIRVRGRKALRAVQHSNGFVMDVTDEEIAEAKAMIGRDGIGCEPASATTLAALRKLVARRKDRSRRQGRGHSDRPRAQGHRFHHQVAAG